MLDCITGLTNFCESEALELMEIAGTRRHAGHYNAHKTEPVWQAGAVRRDACPRGGRAAGAQGRLSRRTCDTRCCTR